MKPLKNILIILTLLTIITPAQAQNLVPNPSFEDYEYCPWDQCQINFATGWYSYGGTPNYCHSCATDEGFGIPNNIAGFQYPSTGNAYSYMCVFFPEYQDERENIGIELIEPLEIGIDYYVSFKASLTNDSRYAIKNLGVLFSTENYSIEPEDIYNCYHDSITLSPPNYAHVYSDEIISDTANWTTISGWFTADSAYNYLIIGNFFDDDNITSIEICPFCHDSGAYYYIDDIYLGKDSIPNNKTEQIVKDNIIAYPNPFSGSTRLKIENVNIIKNYNISLYDVTGNEQTNKISISKQNNNEFLIKRNKLPNGIYFLKVEVNNKVYNSKLVLINKN